MKGLRYWLLLFLLCWGALAPPVVAGHFVVIEKDTFRMYSNPLSADTTLANKVDERMRDVPFVWDVPPYTGWWRLQNDSLFLEKIVDNYTSIHSKDIALMDLKGIFDNYLRDGKIFASWFSGELDVVGGKCIYQAAMGFRSHYEDEWIYCVENGRVTSKTAYHNEWKEAALPGGMQAL